MSLAARIVPIRLPLRSVIATGHGAIRHRHALLLALDDGEFVGWGEAAPIPGWSDDSLADTGRVLRTALETVRRDADMTAAIASLGGHPHARAAISGAWADLGARRDGLPLAPSLTADWKVEVTANANISASEPAAVEREAAGAVTEGYSTIKLKVGSLQPGDDLDRIRALRSVAPDVSLRIDANQAWDRETAIDVLRRAGAADVAWCEEPTAHLDEFGSIQSATGVRIAPDESVVNQTDLRHALAVGLTVIVVKPQAVGGPDRVAMAAELAEDVDATIVVTAFWDSAVGLAHALHVASAYGGPVAHGVAPVGLVEDVGPAPELSEGRIRVPTGPGIGFEPSVPQT